VRLLRRTIGKRIRRLPCVPRLGGLAGAFLLLAGCAPAAKFESVGQRGARIVAGRSATLAEMYSTVAITDESGIPECSGTLVAPQVVVTAAHCVSAETIPGDIQLDLPASAFGVVEGARDVSRASPVQIHRLRSITRHPGFAPAELHVDGLSDANDIAVMVLETEAIVLRPTPILPMAEVDVLVRPRDGLLISGYGESNLDRSGSGLLSLAETPYVGRTERELVAGGDDEPDTCYGDSGGPAYVLSGGVRYLLGVASRGTTVDSACGTGSIFTLASAYEQWLRESGLNAPLRAEPSKRDAGCGLAVTPQVTDSNIVAQLAVLVVCGVLLRRRARPLSIDRQPEGTRT